MAAASSWIQMNCARPIQFLLLLLVSHCSRSSAFVSSAVPISSHIPVIPTRSLQTTTCCSPAPTTSTQLAANNNKDASSTACTMFTLLVVMKFKTQEAKSAWCASLQILGAYVKESEPDTLQYLFSESVDDPMRVTIFETYTSKKDFEEVHMKSVAFQGHLDRTKAFDDDIQTESFITGHAMQEFGYFTK